MTRNLSATTETSIETTPRDWRAVAAATGSGDRTAAEAGVRLAYTRAGLAEPERIVWAASPLAAVELLTSGSIAPGAPVREAVRNGPWAAERARLHTALGTNGYSAHWRATGADLWDLTNSVVERIRAGVIDAAAGDRKRERQIRVLLLDAVLGQHEAAWLSAYDTAPGHPLDGVAAVAAQAGWWWPYAKVAVITERPLELHRDEAGRLDRGDGPALAYADGFVLHAWRGMPVTAEFLDSLRSLTPQRIREEENAELRRVMLEYYGYDRYLTESDARPLHRDETGILWRIALDGDEDVVMVEVVNSTPEPDGAYRTYWLRVPPTTRTAREGVAWTFGLGADIYEPLQQT
ncbi:hypothetical protein BOX37_15940 [Nocardia mangyaensis]|uniref:DUF6745 domain-containing protein n=1 Tax=Nocardia mangyaensis TaxID=2213200 RepID=A0A1J0VT30_9NOCA|nr:hypothetical protein [Nocardia mangyaensis]APE35190.1 hypothetical protein BOX37_15940 [Nocardia mangyaensis]